MSFPLSSIPGLDVGGNGSGGGTPFPPGTGVVIDTAGVGSVLALAPGQGPVATSLSTANPIAQGLAPVFNVHTFGATGDGATDDAAAITAADAAADVVGGIVYFPNQAADASPLVAYAVATPVRPSPKAYWLGQATTAGESAIRAIAPMAAVVLIHNTQTGVLACTPNRLEKLTFDGNGLATDALLHTGDFLSEYVDCFYVNAVRNGDCSANHRLPLILGAVVPSAGGVAGVTVTQPDPFYASQIPLGVNSFVARIVDPGPLDTATYQMSFDGGATFQPAKQFVSALSDINRTSSTSFGPWTGVRFGFPVHAYLANELYTFAVTVQTEDSGLAGCINADLRHHNGRWAHNGTLVSTTVVGGSYAGRISLVAGTATTVAGSQIVAFAGAPSLLGLAIQPGDFISVNGARFPVAGVLDAKHLAVPVGSEPTFSLGGLDFAIGVGSGKHVMGSSENIRETIISGSALNNASSNFRFGGGQGSLAVATRNEFYGMSAYSFGDVQAIPTSNYVVICPLVEGGSNFAQSVYVYSGFDVTVENPYELWTFPDSVGSQDLTQNGVNFSIKSGAATSVPIYAEVNVATSVTIAAAAQQIAMPSTATLGTASLILLTANAPFTLSGAPIFTGIGNAGGIRVRLRNVGAHAITIPHDDFTLSGIVTESSSITLTEQSEVTFVSLGNKLQQETEVCYSTGFTGGQNGRPIFVTTTTTNAPQAIWFVDVVNGAIASGTGITFDILAQAQGGLDYARWTLNTADWDVAANLLGSTIGGLPGPGPNAPSRSTVGAAALWTVSVTTVFPFGQVNIIGDNVNPIEWKIIFYSMGSPPQGH